MPRKSNRRAADIEAEELAAFQRSQKRSKVMGGIMKDRDRGWGRLRDLRGAEVIMVWGVKDELHEANKFKLIVNGKELILDAEEFRKHLRWA